MKILSSFSMRRGSETGFSMLEILLVISAIGVLAGCALFAANRIASVSSEVKLEHDVAVLNTAVRSYLGNGGTLPDSLTPEEIIERLKTRVAGDDAVQLVGHRGPFLDQRIRGRSSKTGTQLRAVWNSGLQRFAMNKTDKGFTEFYLDVSAGLDASKSESRTTALKFAKLMSWVWDFDGSGNSVAAIAPREFATGNPATASYSTPVSARLRRLAPPVFSVPGGLHRYEEFPMPLILSNPNPAGTSQIYYSINNGRWRLYDGLPLSLPQNALNIGVQAYVSSLAPESWEDSPSEGELYQTIYFIGRPVGGFTHAAGDSNLRTSLSGDTVSHYFDWGVPSSGHRIPNSLQFTPSASFGVIPDQEFKLGDVTYYNGTTKAGTNATSVEFKLGLSLDVPRGTETLTFPLRLLSTPNSSSQTADQNADYVWIPNLTSTFSTVIQGKTFSLHLRFGESTTNGFTTVDEFHVHEGKSAKGAVYGRLTADPTNPVIPIGAVAVDTTLPPNDGWSNNTEAISNWENQWDNWSNNWNQPVDEGFSDSSDPDGTDSDI